MKPSDIILAPFRYKPWRPFHLRLMFGDLVGASNQPVRENLVHLEAALAWLCRAQDRLDGSKDEGGISAGWSFENGWLPGYPETSGYTVETFLAASRVLGREDLRQRAERIINWLLSLQGRDGSFPGHFGEVGSRPVVFNTGQIMHGLIEGALAFQRSDCLAAAVCAGRWVMNSQDADGCWRKNVHNGIPHTYNTRAAWALLRTARASADGALEKAARRNFEWALAQQTERGWFANCGFVTDQIPFTHTIAYAVRGLLEAGLLTGDDRYLDAARKAAQALLACQREDGWLDGAFRDGWVPISSFCCLTGVAQLSIVWSRLSQVSDDPTFAQAARCANTFLKRNHRVNDRLDVTDGGIAGSVPIWGFYSRFEFPGWAVKFFADALMTEWKGEVIPTPVK